MKLWKTIPVAMAFVASLATAQTNEEIQKQLARQESELKRLNAELTELKVTGAMTAADAALETEVNRLSERLAAATSVKSGANQLTFGGLFRSRFVLAESDATGTERSNYNRFTVGTTYDFSKDVTAHLSLTDAYTTGFGGGAHIQVYESWVQMRNLFGATGLHLKHGIQEFVKGTQFQFGNEDWNNGLTWDGHVLDYSNEDVAITGFLFNQTATFTTVDSYVTGLYGTLKSVKDMTIDAYWIRNDLATSDTYGARVGGKIEGIDFNAELALQDANLPDDAMAFEVGIGYLFGKDNKFRGHAQYALLENTYTTTALNLGGDRYGYALSINGFNGSGVGFPAGGLESFKIGASFDPATAWTVSANLLLNDADEDFGADLGWTEINVGVHYRYSDTLTMGLGLGYVMPGDNLIDDIVLGFLEARLSF